MPDNPPPAPDWILGSDGHWRPPPFDLAGAGRLPPTNGPGHAAGPPAMGGPGGIPGRPRPPASSGGRLAFVLGAVGVTVVGLLVAAVAAVTFLGTTPAESESVRLSPADGGEGPGDGGEPGDTDDAEATGAPLSERVAVEIAAELEAEGWAMQEAEPVAVDEAGAACMPAGWRDGVADRFRVAFHADGVGDTEVRTAAYGTAEQAQADLARATTDEFRACLEQSAEEHSGADVDVTALAPDPSIPGLTYRSAAVTAEGPLVQDDTYVVVGRVRAYVTYCTCEALNEAHRAEIAREVAVALAAAQGLPGPG